MNIGRFDYIVIGAGSAGCLLANRLSAGGSMQVLLLEAGGGDDWWWFRIPAGYQYTIGNPRTDWCFKTEPEPRLNGREIPFPRGKVLGGSSSINAMLYVRGQAADYDHWRSLGLEGWGWPDVLPFFRKHEDFFGGENAFHATGGEVRVDPQRITWEIQEAVRRAAIENDIPPIADINTGDNGGVGPLHVTQKEGRRWSAADAFLRPALKRSNLAIETGALVERILFEGTRAIGVEYRKNGVRRAAHAARETILAAGAIGTPQILMLSGVGPAAHLARHGIAPVLDRPGVGANLHDHLQLRLNYRVKGVRTLNEAMHSVLAKAGMALQYAWTRRGPLSMAPSQVVIFARSRPEEPRPDLECSPAPFTRSSIAGRFDAFPGLTMLVVPVRPTSRGTLRLKSADPQAPPEILPNYLSTEEDRRRAVDAIRFVRRLMRRPALAPFEPVELAPGPSVGDDEESLVRAAGDIGTTIFHPVGTAKMGQADDPLAVVDARLRVIGLEGLRVIDASVMPAITSGNTNAPTMMIAEKGASFILEDEASR